MHQDIKINLIDTPGYGDFVGELRAGLRAADAALFVISAHEVSAEQGGEGAIDPATVALWKECAAVGMPRAVVVPAATTLAVTSRPPWTPASRPSATESRRCTSPSATEPSSPALRPAVPDPGDRVPDGRRGGRGELIEGIIEQSEDETLMEPTSAARTSRSAR